MPRKVKFRRAVGKDVYAETFALALMQPRKDEDGNRLKGYRSEEILAMTDGERQRLKAQLVTTAEQKRDFRWLASLCR